MKYKFNKNQTLGTPDAESDYNLENVFVENGELDVLKNVLDSKCIVLGRTGSGKSALIKQLERTTDNVIRIDPEAMSIKYLSNSTIINYFRSIDVNLDFFYKILWKHVFIVELLKLYFGEDFKKRENWFLNIQDKLKNKFGKVNPAKQKALKYLKDWSDEFWQSSEYRVKSLENILTEEFCASTGVDVKEINAKFQKSQGVSQKENIEVKHKAESIISNLQADELFEIVSLMQNELFNSTQTKYYLIIDDLDKEWVSPQIVYDLLGSMIEVIKEFQKFKAAKIIIALRINLGELVFSGRRHRGGQREKFSSLYLKLDWDKESLIEVINKRILYLTDNKVNVDSVFNNDKRKNLSSLDYILNRTFLRPREIISYCNKIIQNANTKSYFTNSIVKKAESEYSIERLNALEDEWAENYGEISEICKLFIGIHNGFKLANVKEEIFYEYFCDERKCYLLKGDLKEIFTQWRNDEIKYKVFLSKLFSILHNIGFVGIKKGPRHSVEFVYETGRPFLDSEINNDARIYIHKAFYSVLKINVKEEEVDYLDK